MKKYWLLSGFLAFAACGDICGDGATTGLEECDDTNVNAGDGCDDVCVFEAPKTDYRISELVLVDDVNVTRFTQSNLLIDGAINAAVTAEALTVLVKFGATDGATDVIFGAGAFNDADGTFNFLDDLGGVPVDLTPIPITIADGSTTFAVDSFLLPIETEIGSGIFVGLPIQNVTVTSTFEKIQKGEGGLFFDLISDESTIEAEMAVLDLCAVNLTVGADTINLLNAFDDGDTTNQSSIVPPPGVAPDANNCVPCGGPDNANCIAPDINGERYSVFATFEAKSEHPDNAFDDQSLIIVAP
jgi:cysteine-rich repeat protein